jgi:hypothetical protein
MGRYVTLDARGGSARDRSKNTITEVMCDQAFRSSAGAIHIGTVTRGGVLAISLISCACIIT